MFPAVCTGDMPRTLAEANSSDFISQRNFLLLTYMCDEGSATVMEGMAGCSARLMKGLLVLHECKS